MTMLFLLYFNINMAYWSAKGHLLLLHLCPFNTMKDHILQILCQGNLKSPILNASSVVGCQVRTKMRGASSLVKSHIRKTMPSSLYRAVCHFGEA